MNPIQQISENSFETSNNGKYILSINVHIGGLSFIITSDNTIVKAQAYEWQKQNWEYSLKQIKTLISQEDYLLLNYSKTLLFFNDKRSTLLPSDFFQENQVQAVLEMYLGENDFIGKSQKLVNTDAHLLYAIPKSMVKYLQTTFKNLQLYHQTAIAIEIALKNATDKAEISLRIDNSYFEVIGIINKKLVAHNYFDFSTVDEFMFLLLSFVKHNKFDIEHLNLNLSGQLLMSSPIGLQLQRFFPSIVNQSINKGEEAAFVELLKHSDFANN